MRKEFSPLPAAGPPASGVVVDRPPRCTTSPRYFLLLASAFVLLETMASAGLTPSVISTLERRFGLSSVQSGLWGASFDAASTTLLVPVAFASRRLNKPRVLAWSALLTGVAAAIITLPFFVSEPFVPAWGGSTVACSADNPTRACVSTGFKRAMYAVLVCGQACLGLASVPVFTTTVAYFDDVVPKHRVGGFIAVFYACAALGPAAGFVVGGSLLSRWEDLGPPPRPGLDPSDDGAWVGAWWPGFAVVAVLSVAVSVPMFCFPRFPPNTQAVRDASRAAAAREAQNAGAATAADARLVPTVLRLVRNRVVAFVSVGLAVLALVVSGLATFLPKFIEIHFRLPPGPAAIVTGITIVPGVAGGNLFGGWLPQRLKWSVRQNLKYVAAATTCTCMLLSGFLLSCNSAAVQGEASGLALPCTAQCNCPPDLSYAPVCGAGRAFFSGCHAGCAVFDDATGAFSQCACVAEALGVPANSTAATVTDGVCDAGCTLLLPFLLALACTMFVVFSTTTPVQTVLLSAVPHTERETSLAVSSVATRVFGMAWGPTLFGAILDHTCTLERVNCSSGGKSCLFYDAATMQYVFAAVGALGSLLAGLSYTTAYCCFKGDDSHAAAGTATSAGAAALVPDARRAVDGGGGGGGGGDTAVALVAT